MSRPIAPVGRLLVTHWLDSNQSTATVELCLPRFIYHTNRVSLALDDALDVIAKVHADLNAVIDWGVSPTGLDVMRVDTTRHFSPVLQPDMLLNGLRYASANGPRVTAYTSHEGIASLRASRQDWVARLYDKGRELMTKASKLRDPILKREAEAAISVLRFEAVARRPLLKRRGLLVVSDLSPGNLAQLNRWVFERAKFHTEVGGLSKLKAAAILAMSHGKKEYSDFAKAFALLHLEALGYDPPQTSRTTLKRLRRVAKRYGLTAADFQVVDRPSLRLDYDSGRLLDGDS